MEVLKISGGEPLHGEIEVAGSKNAALALLSAIPLAEGEVVLHNVPDISDVEIKLSLLSELGAEIRRSEGSVFINAGAINRSCFASLEKRPIRTSFYMLGPILARFGNARIPVPGGCQIGARPVDFHIKGLEKLGAKVTLEEGVYNAECNELIGTEIYLDFPSAGATQHLMSAATRAKGITTIQNAAVEPEVIALAGMLGSMGARIEGAGTSTITIYGVDRIEGGSYRVPSDRVQAGTYLLAGAVTCGDVTVRGILPDDQTALIQKLRQAGINAEEGPDWVRVWCDKRPDAIKVRTMPHPGFPTDLQQPMAALLATADGTSVIEETIYESRTGHVSELKRMGARVTAAGRTTVIEGVQQLSGCHVLASDLRAGAALIIAGLAAEGTTTIGNLHYIDRGYEALEDHLRSLGAKIERVTQPTTADTQ